MATWFCFSQESEKVKQKETSFLRHALHRVRLRIRQWRAMKKANGEAGDALQGKAKDPTLQNLLDISMARADSLETISLGSPSIGSQKEVDDEFCFLPIPDLVPDYTSMSYADIYEFSMNITSTRWWSEH
ncbi:unnamed protein product [Agarophyton chilense]